MQACITHATDSRVDVSVKLLAFFNPRLRGVSSALVPRFLQFFVIRVIRVTRAIRAIRAIQVIRAVRIIRFIQVVG